MALKNPPGGDKVTNDQGYFRSTWIDFFSSITRESRKGWSGTFTNADGVTVTVENGKITDVS